MTFPLYSYIKRFEEVEPLSFAVFDTVMKGIAKALYPTLNDTGELGKKPIAGGKNPDYSYAICAAQAKRLKEAGSHT